MSNHVDLIQEQTRRNQSRYCKPDPQLLGALKPTTFALAYEVSCLDMRGTAIQNSPTER